jgi:hypothetical protein
LVYNNNYIKLTYFMENKKLWFRAKKYGLGWYPISWEGWVILILYLVAIVQYFIQSDIKSHSVSDTLINFATPFIVNTIFLLIICYARGEKPKWRWG